MKWKMMGNPSVEINTTYQFYQRYQRQNVSCACRCVFACARKEESTIKHTEYNNNITKCTVLANSNIYNNTNSRYSMIINKQYQIINRWRYNYVGERGCHCFFTRACWCKTALTLKLTGAAKAWLVARLCSAGLEECCWCTFECVCAWVFVPCACVLLDCSDTNDLLVIAEVGRGGRGTCCDRICACAAEDGRARDRF